MAFHHGTLRKYTAALLDFFNSIEIQYQDSNNNTIVRNIPITYTSKEKSRIIDTYTGDQLMTGNINVLPRAALSLTTMTKLDNRITNKNNKINLKSNANTFEYMYNSVPYEFSFELTFMCRGMNEASQVVEQLAPIFNPTVNIDIWDAQNLNEPTRVPVRLLDINIENEDYDEISSNITTVSMGLSLIGNFYPPIHSTERIREFKLNINQSTSTSPTTAVFDKKIIKGWDVTTGGKLINETSLQVQGTNYPPVIIDIVAPSVLILGTNNLNVIYSDKDNGLHELTFFWELLQGVGTITGTLDNAVIDITTTGIIEPQVTITDAFGNYTTLSKVFTV